MFSYAPLEPIVLSLFETESYTSCDTIKRISTIGNLFTKKEYLSGCIVF